MKPYRLSQRLGCYLIIILKPFARMDCLQSSNILITRLSSFGFRQVMRTQISYDSMAAVLTLNAPKFVSVENTLDTLRIIPLTTALATYTAKLRSVMRDTAGNVSSVNLIETGVVIKRKDGWKLLSGQTSLLN